MWALATALAVLVVQPACSSDDSNDVSPTSAAEVQTSTTTASWQIDDPQAWLQERLELVAAAFCDRSPAGLDAVYSSSSEALPTFKEVAAAGSACPDPVVESIDMSGSDKVNETNSHFYAIVSGWTASRQRWSVFVEYEGEPKIDNDPSESSDCSHDPDVAPFDLCAGHEPPES